MNWMTLLPKSLPSASTASPSSKTQSRSATQPGSGNLRPKNACPMPGFAELAKAGGLIGYGANLPALFRRAGYFVDKILRGAKPSDIPVEQPTEFETVVNLKTARALGLAMAPSLVATADDVIE
jgi:ABC transporter substrate binding protein